MPPIVGVCSWSLQPASPKDLADRVRAVDVAQVQIALDPMRSGDWSLDETRSILADLGIGIRSGMMRMAGEDYSTLESIRQTGGLRSDFRWQENLRAAGKNADVGRALGVDLVTFHAGFIPEDRGDPVRALLIERLQSVADAFAQRGVRIGLETGQETAETLLDMLDELARPTVGVNFDPANMILYGMGDPVEALEKLAPRVAGIHIKDAVPSPDPESWGTEVPVGTGDVDWPGFFDVIERLNIRADWMIERESGTSRVADIRRAKNLVDPFLHE